MAASDGTELNGDGTIPLGSIQTIRANGFYSITAGYECHKVDIKPRTSRGF